LDIATYLSLNKLFGSRHQGKAKPRRPSPLPAWHGIDSFWIAWYWLILDIACSASRAKAEVEWPKSTGKKKRQSLRNLRYPNDSKKY
jgi:hypothetical protein